jgi:hypothetical protein
MDYVRSKSIQLVEVGIDTLQLVDTTKIMNVYDSDPVVHRSPIKEASPCIRDFLHQRSHIDPQSSKVWYIIDENGNMHDIILF